METLVINTIDDLEVLNDNVFDTNNEITIITPSVLHQLYMKTYNLETIITTLKDFINKGIKLGYLHHSWYDDSHKSKIHILTKEE